MNQQEREKAAAELAGILARGCGLHIEAHGPDGNAPGPSRAGGGSRYEVVAESTGGAASFVECGGERFAVTVTPLARETGYRLQP